MNKYKKMLSGLVISSLLISHMTFSYASNDTGVALTSDEKQKVQSEILSLQSQLFAKGKTSLETFTSEFKKISQYEESGNSKIDAQIDADYFGSGKLSLALNNYHIKNALTNSDISSNVAFSGIYTPSYGSGFEIDLSSFASLISKNGEIYALLKDFNFKVNDENLSKILENLKKQFADNRYIQFPTDEESKKIYEMMQGLSTQTILSESQKVFSQPLFSAYKKQGDKYLLVPSKYACDTYFELDTKFHFNNAWYTPSTCTESTYKTLVQSFVKNGSLYLILGKNTNTLGYDMQLDDTQVKAELDYDDTHIQKVTFDMIPDQQKFKNEFFSFSYRDGQSINAKLVAEEGKMYFDFVSTLDANNHFTQIQSKLKSSQAQGTFLLKDKKIQAQYILKENGYTYYDEDWKPVLKNVYGIKITGNMDEQNILANLNLKFAAIDVETKKVFFTTKASYDTGKFALEMASQDEYSPFSYQAQGFLSKEKLRLVSNYNIGDMYTGNLNIIIDQSEDKNNLDFDFTLKNDEKNIASIQMYNNAQRVYKENIEIEIPKDFKKLDLTELENINY